MDVKICSTEELLDILQNGYVDSYVISIRDTAGSSLYAEIDKYVLNCINLFHLYFDDIWSPEHLFYNYHTLRYGQLLALLKWVSGKNSFIIQCTSGLSRSAAIAYVIGCGRMKPEEAAKLLDLNKHHPNPFVVKLGAKVLNNPSIETYGYSNFTMLDTRDDPCKGMPEFVES